MKLLITGIPGTGKTSFGNFLQSEKGYEHFDMESVLKKHGKEGSSVINEFINNKGEKKVITWGFIPKTDDQLVRNLQSSGYRMIWFDGDRESARREFLNRGDTSEDLFDLQLSKIVDMDLDSFNPVKINTFDHNGVFFTSEEVVKLIEGDRT